MISRRKGLHTETDRCVCVRTLWKDVWRICEKNPSRNSDIQERESKTKKKSKIQDIKRHHSFLVQRRRESAKHSYHNLAAETPANPFTHRIHAFACSQPLKQFNLVSLTSQSLAWLSCPPEHMTWCQKTCRSAVSPSGPDWQLVPLCSVFCVYSGLEPEANLQRQKREKESCLSLWCISSSRSCDVKRIRKLSNNCACSWQPAACAEKQMAGVKEDICCN